MCLNNFSDDSNPPLNSAQLMVYEVLMFHKNTELLPSGDSYEIYSGNNDPTKRITLVFFGIPVIIQRVWVEVEK